MAELERAVSVHRLHFQDAVVLLPLEDGGFVGLLLERWRVLVDVVYLDVHGGPDGGKFSGLKLETLLKHVFFFFNLHFGDSLVRFLHVGPIGTLPTVVCLDGERVLLLQLTIHLVFGPDDSLSSGLVQDHGLEGNILPVDPEATDLT